MLLRVIDPMRAVIQRVSQASVSIDGQVHSRIGAGLLILLGIEEIDVADDVEWLAGKIARLRIFGDEEGQMNRSIQDTGDQALVVSQFTLHGSTRKGNRPSFIRAARPETAEPLYRAFVSQLTNALGQPVATGEFGALMDVSLVNTGPVTIWIDSQRRE